MSRMFEFHRFGERRPDSPVPPDTAILMGTPIGSIVMHDNKTLGETGHRAQILSEALGAPVVAYQDIGPKVRPLGIAAARRRLAPDQFDEYAEEFADTIGRDLARRDIHSAVMRIHSGDGPLGTTIGRAFTQPEQTVRITHMAVSDPAGMTAASFMYGMRSWLNYRRTLAPLAPPEHRTPATIRIPGATIGSVATDILVRGRTVWPTERTYRNLTAIAADPTVALLLSLPDNTFLTNPERREEITTGILQAAALRPEGSMPVVVRSETDHWHSSSHDNPARSAALVREIIELSR